MVFSLEIDHLLGLGLTSLPSSVPVLKAPFTLSPDGARSYTGIGVSFVSTSTSDPQDQIVAENAHTAALTCCSVSSDGLLAATAQSADGRGFAPVVLWDTDGELTPLKVIELPAGAVVYACEFSPDGDFLLLGGTTPQGGLVAVVSTDEGILIEWARMPFAVTSLCFSPLAMPPVAGHPAYTAVATAGATCARIDLVFSRAALAYTLTTTPFTFPSSGLARALTCCTVSLDGAEALVGTAAGEVLVFDLLGRERGGVFKRALVIAAAPLTSMVTVVVGGGAGRVLVGCAAGTVSVMRRGQVQFIWETIQQVRLAGGVAAATRRQQNAFGEVSQLAPALVSGSSAPVVALAAAKEGESQMVTVVQADGMVCSLDSSACCLVSTSLIAASAPPTAVAAHPTRPEIVALALTNGVVEVWSLETYAPVAPAVAVARAGSSCSQLVWGADGVGVYGAWSDGTVSALKFHGTTLTKAWTVPSAHRGGVNALAVAPATAPPALITGGNDSALRLWRLETGSVVHQITPSASPICAIEWDCVVDSLVHVASVNGALTTVDLKAPRGSSQEMARFRQLPAQAMALSQRRAGECEILASCVGGGNLVFDFDLDEPSGSLDGLRGTLQALVTDQAGDVAVGFDQSGDIGIWDLRQLNNSGTNYVQMQACDHVHALIGRVGAGGLAVTADRAQVVVVSDNGCLCVANIYED